jgi:hypothetical protein
MMHQVLNSSLSPVFELIAAEKDRRVHRKLVANRFPTLGFLCVSVVDFAFNLRSSAKISGEWSYPFAFNNCSACCLDVSVNLAPLSIRATSSVRSSGLNARTSVRVRPAASRFSIK